MEISCIICLNDLLSSDQLLGTICGHVCHAACMTNWLQRSSTCPQCRLDLKHRDIRRIYLNFKNNENSSMANYESEVKSLQNLLQHLEYKIKMKNEEVTRQITVINHLNKQIKVHQRQLTSSEEKCLKLVKSAAELSKKLSDRRVKYSETEQKLKTCVREKLELQARLDSLEKKLVPKKKKNVESQNNLVVPILEKKASDSTDNQCAARTNANVKPKKQVSRPPLRTVNQNNEKHHYNLRPR